MFFNNVSGGTPSTAMALLYPKIPCVMVNTGGNYPEAWENMRRLRADHNIRVIVICSPNKNHPTYYEYIKAEGLKPFYNSCSDKAKQHHLDYFYNTLPGTIHINVGLLPEEPRRVEEFPTTGKLKYHFPLIEKGYTREICEKILRKHDMLIIKTGCYFCGKQPEASWNRLEAEHPDLYQECIEQRWREPK